MRELTNGTGVDVVYDGVGKDTFDDSLAALRIRGTLVLFGAASGPVPPVDPQRLNSGGSLYLTRPTLKDHLLNPQERRWRSDELFAAVVASGAPGWGRNTLADAAHAHEDLQPPHDRQGDAGPVGRDRGWSALDYRDVPVGDLRVG